MINYSIIIPFRGQSELLYKAVASVPERADAEVIIVDNNPHPLPTEDVPRKQKTSVVYLTSDPNMGAGRARNVGLKYVQGRWLLFLDADDYFTDEAFVAFDRYLESDADIIFFDADSINLVSGLPSNRHRTVHQFLNDYLKTGNEDSIRYRFVNPISKMMRASFVLEGGFQFEETKVANDQMFSIWTGHAAQKVLADATKVYMITAGEKNTSLTKTKSAENQFVRYQVAIRQYHFMESIGRKDLRFHLLSFVVHSFMDFGLMEGIKYLKYAMKEKVNIFLR